MKTLKDFETLIRDNVLDTDAKDPNWRWSVHSLEEDRVQIRWGYLDYMESPTPFFTIEVVKEEDVDYPDECWLRVRDHDSDLITGEFVTDAECKKSWQVSWESGIQSLLDELEYYAHTRY